MNKISRLFLIVIFTFFPLFFSNQVIVAQAQSPNASTPSASTSEVIDKLKQIQVLKEKIATKVAELREKEKVAHLGTVFKIDKTTITISTPKGEHGVTYSEDTTYYQITGNSKKEIAIINIDEGDAISVFGYSNGDKTLTSAKYI